MGFRQRPSRHADAVRGAVPPHHRNLRKISRASCHSARQPARAGLLRGRATTRSTANGSASPAGADGFLQLEHHDQAKFGDSLQSQLLQKSQTAKGASDRAGFDHGEPFSVTRGLDPRVRGSPGQARSSPAMTGCPDGSTWSEPPLRSCTGVGRAWRRAWLRNSSCRGPSASAPRAAR